MNKTFPTLYSVDSSGNTRLWWMEQLNNQFRTISGIKGGKLVTSEWTVCEGKNLGKKNATSSETQAETEILAKYKKQLKTGYAENEKDASNGTTYVEPMLAKLYKDYADKIDFSKQPWVIQIKFNGNRCVATKDGLFTRKGEKYISVPHIFNSLKSFFQKNPDAVLDGELYNYELRQTLNELSKLVRKTVHITDEDLKRSEKIVKFYIYDGYGFDGLKESDEYSVRKSWIDKNIIGKYNYTEFVKSHTVKSKSDLDSIYKEFVDDDEEGGILRKTDEGYEHKRSKFLLKLKPEDDSEATIIDIKEGTGNWAGTGKIITLKWNGVEFDATFKGSYEQAVEFLKKKKSWIGKEVTFIYNGLTGLGVPNYARVDINNCLKTDK